jgi:hypothetical protein
MVTSNTFRSALLVWDVALSAIVSESWEVLFPIEIDTRLKALVTACVDVIIGIFVLCSMVFFLSTYFYRKLDAKNLRNNLIAAQANLQRTYRATFIMIILASFSMAIANLLTQLAAEFFVWMTLFRGKDLELQMRNTCRHEDYTAWVSIGAVVYAFFISFAVAYLSVRLQRMEMRTLSPGGATTFHVAAVSLADTAGWTLWNASDVSLGCLPEGAYNSVAVQLSRLVVCGGLGCFIYVLVIPPLAPSEDHQEEGTGEAEEESEETYGLKRAWVRVMQESCVIATSLSIVTLYYMPLTYFHPRAGKITAYLIAGCTTLIAPFAMGYFSRNLDRALNRFAHDNLVWLTFITWIYPFGDTLDVWTEDGQDLWKGIVLALLTTCAGTLCIVGVLKLALASLAEAADELVEESWIFGVVRDEMQKSLLTSIKGGANP